MAYINIENAAISVQLNKDGTVVVPSGEVWNVVANVAAAKNDATLKINSTDVVRTSVSSVVNDSAKFFVKGGDILKLDCGSLGNGGAHISGFIVQQQ